MRVTKNGALGSLTAAAIIAIAASALAAPATDPVDQGEVFNIATFKVKPGQEAAFEQIMRQVVVDSRAEPGNLEYRFQQSVDDPHVYVAYEVFKTAEDAKSHINSEHIQRVVPAVLEMLYGAIDVKTYKIVK